jgi:hypothetical protein
MWKGVATTKREKHTGAGQRPTTIVERAQRLVIRTSRGRWRSVWQALYGLLARGYAAWLRGASRRSTVFVRGSLGAGQLRAGFSDIDLTVIVPGDAAESDRASQRVLARHELLRRRLPQLGKTILDRPLVLEAGDLTESSFEPTMTAGLRGCGHSAVYFGEASQESLIALHNNPGLTGPAAGWRRISGPPRALPGRRFDRDRLRIAAWLALQARWRWLLQTCPDPAPARRIRLCLKLASDPLRIWLALGWGEAPGSLRDVLELSLRRLPAYEPAVLRALKLERDAADLGEPPMAEFLADFVSLTAGIARLLEAEVAPAGYADVAIDWRASDRLMPTPVPRGLPLADWRALTRAGVRSQGRLFADEPDETLSPVSLDPARLDHLIEAVLAGRRGPYPALRSGPLCVLASRRWPRTHLRAVQCALTDPVSFALLSGSPIARYPNVPGWSAADTAARAVAEHRAWLDQAGAAEEPEALGMLITAMRAAFFQESIQDDRPSLAATVAATLRALESRDSGPCLADDVEEAYLRWRSEGTAPDRRLLADLRVTVAGLDCYRADASRLPVSLSSASSRAVR